MNILFKASFILLSLAIASYEVNCSAIVSEHQTSPPSYYMGKKDPEEEKRWGISSLVDSASDTLGDVADLAGDKASSLKDSILDKGEELAIPYLLEDVRDFLEEKGVQLSPEEVRQLALDIQQEIEYEELKKMVDEMSPEELLALGNTIMTSQDGTDGEEEGEDDATVEKRWGVSSLVDSVSDTVDDVSDFADDAQAKAEDLKDTVVAKGDELMEGNMTAPLDQVTGFLDANGVPLSADAVEDMAQNLDLDQLEMLVKDVPIEDLVALSGDVLGGVSSQTQSQSGSVETTLLSMEILDKVTKAKILIEGIGQCGGGETSSQAESESAPAATEDASSEQLSEVKRNWLLSHMIGKRNDLLYDYIGKRNDLLYDYIGKRFKPIMAGKREMPQGEMTEEQLEQQQAEEGEELGEGEAEGDFVAADEVDKRGDSMRSMIGKRGDAMRSMIGKRGDAMRSMIGKRDGSDVLDEASMLLSLLPQGGAAPAPVSDSCSNTGNLYTILDGINEIVARLELLA